MSHIYIDGTKITANANKGNDQLLTGYNIQQCKQKNHRGSLFRESRLFDMLFFTAPIVRLHKRKVFVGLPTPTTFYNCLTKDSAKP